MSAQTEDLRRVKNFEDLIRYLEDYLDWPIAGYGLDDLTFEYSAEELGLKDEDVAKVQRILQLRPLQHGQPWGIFFVEFERKKLPVVVLRRILSHLVVKTRASANRANAAAWNAADLLFISAYGDERTAQREVAFAHFHQESGDLPTLRVLGWDGADTALKLEHVAATLQQRLHWPDDPNDHDGWREQWSGAFRHRLGHTIRTANELADALALLARNIRNAALTLLNVETERGPLRQLHKAFKTTLIHDLTEANFADTYAQTITYGLLTAAINRTDLAGGPEDTTLHTSMLADVVPVTNPFLKEMLQTFLKAGGRKGGIDFDELGVQDVVSLLRGGETDLPAILRDFGNKTQGEDPVIHFYEHFLAAYDKQLKVQRGVFYTPKAVVSYIVRSVHELLQSEFGLADGLADTATWGEMAQRLPNLKIPEGTSPDSPFVVILDPATGTATFLVEVIDVIHRTLTTKWRAQGMSEAQRRTAWNEYVPNHLLPRLYGYELMMAPYAIAHMKIGLKLHETGYRFGSDERVRVYLTNALEPADDVQKTFEGILPALAHESQAVNGVKRDQLFTLVIGNPPYSNFGQLNRIPYILELLKEYKRGLDEKKINLDDDYIKFVRYSQSLLSRTGIGILGYITNNVFLDGLTHREMRRSLVESFSHLWLLDLHGSAKKLETSQKDVREENVFDIQQGVSITILLKHPTMTTQVQQADLWGSRESKYRVLESSCVLRTKWSLLAPSRPHFFLVPKNLSGQIEYEAFPSLAEAFFVYQNGLKTDRDSLFFDFNRNELEQRISEFYSKTYSDNFAKQYGIHASSSYDIEARRDQTHFSASSIKLCLYRPFDYRWIYYDPNLTSRPAAKVMRHQLAGKNLSLICLRQTRRSESGTFFVSRRLINKDAVSLFDIATVFPLYLYGQGLRFSLAVKDQTEDTGDRHHNFRDEFIHAFANKLDLLSVDTYELPQEFKADDIFQYIYATFHSPSYRIRYAEFLKIDFPRVPLTSSPTLFQKLAQLGSELISLHLVEFALEDEHSIPTTWPRYPRLTHLSGSDHSIIKFPSAEKAWQAGRVAINSSSGFEGVPEEVWNFQIGGYQVCHKWLKDRNGLTLSDEDILHYSKIVTALHETIRIMEEIDAVIDDHGGWPDAFMGE